MFRGQHYVALAKTIRQVRLNISANKAMVPPHQVVEKLEAIGQLQMALIELLKKDNPRFQEFTFIGECSEHKPDYFK